MEDIYMAFARESGRCATLKCKPFFPTRDDPARTQGQYLTLWAS
jgi:hypothetical protein